MPLLREPGRSWDDVAITTYGDYGNFSVRGDRYRYTIYANGDEELYDLQNDPNEWINLADDRNYEEIKRVIGRKNSTVHEEHAPPVGGIDELQQQ